MNYVEWLRVRNVMRVLAVILGLLIVLSLILRISFNKEITQDDAFILHMQRQSGSTVQRSVLPDGTNRTTILDPADQTSAVIDNYGVWGRHIVITEPRSKSRMHESHAVIGSFSINQQRQGDSEITTIDTDSRTPFIFYMVLADVVALLIATLLAAPFARESDGHLEYALTKPVSRESFALQTMAADYAGILGASLMTVFAIIVCQSMFEIPQFDFRGVSTAAVLMGIAAPFAWYAFLNAVTASMKRGYGAVLGFAWPVAILIAILAIVPLGSTILGTLVHNIFWLVSRIDPLSYVSMNVTENHATGELVGPANFAIRLGIEVGLFIIYSALAVFQWKRVEA